MRRKRLLRLGPSAAVLTLVGLAITSELASAISVDGVVGLHPVEDRTCVAIWIPISEDQALAGLSWYNNDEMVVYPEVLLESGTQDYPVGLDDCRTVALSVQGISSGWSTVVFDDVARSLSEGLYVLIRFPEGSEYTDIGTGGGAALGYSVAGDGYTGWISVDGEDWIAIAGEVGFSVEPLYVDASEATIVMLGRSARGHSDGLPGQTRLNRPAPNPSNPGTTIEYSLVSQEIVELCIHDIRGMKIRTLVNGVANRGDHSVYWDGRDDGGRAVASGVYFARLSAKNKTMTQKLVLIR